MSEDRKKGLFQRLADAFFEEVDGAGPGSASGTAEGAGKRSTPPPAGEMVTPTAPERDAAAQKRSPTDDLEAMAALQRMRIARRNEGEPTPDSDRIVPAFAPPPSWVAEFGPLEPPGPKDEAIRQVKFEQRLSEILQSGKTGAAGKLQLLDLEEIKDKLGDRWQSIADRAMQIAEGIIERRLSSSDVLARYEDDSYVILFADLTEEQARLKAAAIAREVRERLLGELDLSEDWVKAYVGDLKEIDRVRQETGAEATVKLGGIAGTLEGFRNIAPPTHGGKSAAELELIRRVGEVGVTYRPTFAVARNGISIYEAQALRLDDLNHMYSGAHAYPRGDAAVCFEVDREVLFRSITLLKDLAKADALVPIRVPVTLSSWLAHSFGQLVDACRALSPTLRRYLVIDIQCQSAQAPVSRIGEAIHTIEPFCRAITVTLPIDFADLDKLHRLKVVSVGYDLDAPEFADATPSLIQQKVLPLAKRAHERQMQAHLAGIHIMPVAKAARDSGFDFLNGPAIRPTVDRPRGSPAAKSPA